MNKKLSVLAIMLAALTIPQCVKAHDFSAVSPSSHTLYYRVNSPNTVYLTYPNDTATQLSTCWEGFTKPVGNIIIPDSVQYGGQWFNVLWTDSMTFANCTAITSVTLPSHFQEIGNFSFYGCSALASINLENTNINTIGMSAFHGCSALASINLENTNIIAIGMSAFHGCSSLQSIKFPTTLTEIPSANTYETGVFYNCTALRVVTISENIRTIGFNAFYGCNNIDTVYFNADSCHMGGYFYCSSDFESDIREYPINWTSLKARNIIFGDNVTTIEIIAGADFSAEINGYYIFHLSSSGFRNITFGRNVGLIGVLLPQYTDSIIFKGDTPPTIVNILPQGWNFNYPCIIPCGTITQYRSRLPFFTNLVEDEFSFSATSNNENMGVVQILNLPTCANPNAVLNAVPANGYRFDHWSTGSTINPYNLTITSDTVITAYFVSEGGSDGIDDINVDNINIYSNDGHIVVEGVDGVPVHIYDMMGRETAQDKQSKLSNGVYFVKVGNLPAHKVVVMW